MTISFRNCRRKAKAKAKAKARAKAKAKASSTAALDFALGSEAEILYPMELLGGVGD
jgi:hypothetical protein